MIEVYAFATPNSVKVPIALEELGLAYELRGVNIRAGEQKTDAFVALNPNARVPVLVDHDVAGAPLVLSESVAILVYLAEKTGKLIPADITGRAHAFEQMFFHASGLSPAFGNAGFFRKFVASPQPLAEKRFVDEGERIIGVLDDLLAARPFVAGDQFSIADIAHFGWLWRREFPGFSFDGRPNVQRWYDRVANRPAVQRGIDRVTALASQN